MNSKLLKLLPPLVFAASAFAAPSGPESSALKMLESKGYTLGRSFDAGHGLTGWTVVKAGQSTVVFITPDGKALLIGAMIDDKGANLTQGFVDRYANDPALAKAYSDFGSSVFIDQKPAVPVRRILYVVFDANCPYCSLAFSTLQKYISSGLEIRWLPVAYLKADSANRAAAILGAADPVAALVQNETGFNETTHEGGVAPASEVAPSVVQALQKNDLIMQSLKSTSTPTFLWKDDAGVVRESIGLPNMQVTLDMIGINPPR